MASSAHDVAAASLEAFVTGAVKAGTVARTNGRPGYAGLPSFGYRQEVDVTSGDEKVGIRHFPRVHRVAALLKRWLRGTRQGAVVPRYPDYYLDDFTCRLNRRTSQSHGKLFRGLLEQSVAVGPAPLPQMKAAAHAKAMRERPESIARSTYIERP